MTTPATREPGGWKGERGTRQQRGYGAAWSKLRLVILRRDLYLCQPCRREGRPTPAAAVDHIKPKAKGGTDDHDNLQGICLEHHKAKSATDMAPKPRLKYDANGWPIW